MHSPLLYALYSSLRLGSISLAAAQSRPNIVFIMTDDQDVHMESLNHMPLTQQHLVSQGATFEKHYCTVAICCPSRVNLWTGQMSHNTNVTNVQPPWGGYQKFIQNGYNDHHLALWMQQSGYNTYYTGKLYNGHTPFTYQYFNVSITYDAQPPENPVGVYSTDLLADTAYRYLEDAFAHPDTPFFLTVAPVAPHGQLTEYPEHWAGPPQVAERHRGLFPNYTIPRTPDFNPDTPTGVNWVAQLPKLNDTMIAYNDEYQRERLRSLQAVDEMVAGIVTRLEDAGVLDNTYVFYTSDNGFHIGQHRMHPGKMCGYETDINVPMIVRGPGIAPGSLRSGPTSHTNLAPTIMKLAGNDISNKSFDGAPLDLHHPDTPLAGTEHLAVEFWGIGLAESYLAGEEEYPNNTYKAVRIHSDDYSYYYSVWCNNAKELYDMKTDPLQLHNLLPESDVSSAGDRDLTLLTNRLDALMMVLKSCKEESCISPWQSLHPDGNVGSLTDALDHQYDDFYERQTKVSYTRCERGYIIESEGPQDFDVFGRSGIHVQARGSVINPHWSLWE
ncbi:alkaline-phosphatase-like protein [Stachybotrys elegans]|uniref:Alkaline-phosphatase-like protein n=1 Tax=Stachybotrys elegans TaxID=80388 RepID=A0A8K0SP44_9HYPO|nr:alkaline-phosphatase-like protein [Stachybotrys elegans]